MASLQVRELPENIYQMLVREAERENRSLAQEAIAVLARGLQACENPQARRHKLLAEMEHQAPVSFKIGDPAAMIREDRER